MSVSTVNSTYPRIDCGQQHRASVDEMLGEDELAMASAIGKALRAHRLSLGFSVTDVAVRGLKRDQVHRVSALEAGDASGNISTLLKVFSALDMGDQVSRLFSEIASKATCNDLAPVPRHLRALGLKTALDQLVEQDPSRRYSIRELGDMLGEMFHLDLRDESTRRNFAQRVHRAYHDALKRHETRQQRTAAGQN